LGEKESFSGWVIGNKNHYQLNALSADSKNVQSKIVEKFNKI
jgi:hypothetical protein